MIANLLGWILFGLIVGGIARLLVPGRQPMGILMTMALGVVGSLVGGFISWTLTGMDDPYHPAKWIMSILGAVIVLAIYVAYARRTRTI
jgi:uncharacterized membrane protein YeaQ/YmgE (transglycosylase-associated protein family)